MPDEVVKRDGSIQSFDFEKTIAVVKDGFEKVPNMTAADYEEYMRDFQIHKKFRMHSTEIQNMLLQLAVEKIKTHSTRWGPLATVFHLHNLYKESAIAKSIKTFGYGKLYDTIEILVHLGKYKSELLELYTKKEIETINSFMVFERDYKFPYAGARLMSRYTINPIELFQELFVVNAMSLCMYESKETRLQHIKDLYDTTSLHFATLATPIFANARKPDAQTASCFIGVMEDNLESIFDVLTSFANVSKWGGGLGLYAGRIRSSNSDIRGHKNASGGFIPFGKIYNDTALAVNQLGNRAGSASITMEMHQRDILDFLQCKTNVGDERKKLHDIFPAISIPGLFWDIFKKNGKWYLMCPHEIEKIMGFRLENYFGEEYNKRYWECVNNESLKKDEIAAKDLWKEVLKSLYETGGPFVFYRDEVNKMNPNAHAGIIPCSNLCVTGDTKLLTNNGYRNVKELYETQENFKVVIDNRTKNNNVSEKSTSLVDAIPMHLTAKNADVYKLTTKQGFEMKSTLWHEYYVQRKDSIIKIPMSKVKIGDKILVQSNEGYFGDISEPVLAYITGIIAADGTYGNSRSGENKPVRIDLYGKKQLIGSKVSDCINQIIKENINKDIKYKHNTNFEPNFNFSESANKISTSSALLSRVLEEKNVYKDSKRKIPNFVWNGTKETQANYLSGLFQMDASVNIGNNNKSGSIEIKQTNKEFIKEIQQLLLNFGVYSTFYFYKRKKNLLPDGKGGKKEYDCKDSWKLVIQDRTSRDRFVSCVELKEKDKEKIISLNRNLQPKSRRAKHQFTAEVSNIEFFSNEDVYDTTQPEYNSLIFNGIVTGNCTEIAQNVSANGPLQKKTYVNEEGKTVVVQERTIGDFVVCNLASINLSEVWEGEELEKTIKVLVRALDNSISINNPPTEEARITNERYRAIGIGAMGYANLIASQQINWNSEKHVDFADKLFENIAYFTIKASMELSKEKGYYPLFPGSDWQTGAYFEKRNYTSERWLKLKEDVMKYGLRNGYLMSPAPNASTAMLVGASAGTDAIYDKYWIEAKKGMNYPVYAKNLDTLFWHYQLAHQVNQTYTIKAAAARQKHIDQSMSLNLYITNETTAQEITKMYYQAYQSGIKTVYYLRSRSLEAEDCVSCSA